MLSAPELAAYDRGQTLKRIVRASAALRDLYDDTAIAKALGLQHQSVGNWWTGTRPSVPNLFDLARITGLSADELTRFLYSDGPLPTLPEPGSWVASSVQEGLRLGRQRQQQSTPDKPSQSPPRQPRGSGAGRG